MTKRPLCLAAFLLLFLLWCIPKEVWLTEPDIPSATEGSLTGTIYRREETGERQVYYLKNCLRNGTESIPNVLVYEKSTDAYSVGNTITFYGTIYQLNEATNPGQFDGEFYYQCQGIVYTFQSEGSTVKDIAIHPAAEGLTKLKVFLKNILAENFCERDAGILSLVLLGDRELIREEDQLLYQQNGISHLLSISGLHISMIGLAIYRLLRRLGATFAEAGIPSAVFILLYGMMTGFGVSSVRAICMFLVMIFGEIIGRTYDMASGMALAAILLLLNNPLQAHNASFLLSFGAVGGICIVYPILKDRFSTENKLMQSLLFSVSLNLVTYPITVHFYYEYPLYSILLNLIVVPLMSAVMLSGAAGMFAAAVCLPLAKVLILPCHLILWFYDILGRTFLKLPGARLTLGAEEFWQLSVYFLLLTVTLLVLWYGKKRMVCALLPVAVLVVTLRFRSGLSFTMLDVGQGDALFLRMPSGTTCLIDGGSTSEKNIGQYKLLPFLKYEGVSHLDYVIFTHLDADHTNGIRELLEKCEDMDGISIGRILFPAIQNPDEKYQELWNLTKQRGIEAGTIGAGDCFQEEGLLMECLWPMKHTYTADKNQSSTVLQLTCGEFTMLLTGDLGMEGEAALLQTGMLQDVDVWKVSHHGSKYSGSETFLAAILPELSLISVSERNSYGHPNPALLNRLQFIGSQIWTTPECGAIRIHSDGEVYTVEGF